VRDSRHHRDPGWWTIIVATETVALAAATTYLQHRYLPLVAPSFIAIGLVATMFFARRVAPVTATSILGLMLAYDALIAASVRPNENQGTLVLVTVPFAHWGITIAALFTAGFLYLLRH
jgi:hypothetical protein